MPFDFADYLGEEEFQDQSVFYLITKNKEKLMEIVKSQFIDLNGNVEIVSYID